MQVEGNVILIVDDDEMNLMVAKMVLEKKLSCEVITAENGVDGIEILRRRHVSLVLLDIEMPFMDGFEALKAIRADVKIRHVPIIMLTASADKETITKVARQGVNGYIKKPFLPDDLVNRVKSCLGTDDEQKNILVVDADAEIRQTAKKIIDETLPYNVFIADSGIAALELLKTRQVDIILMSLELPFMDGLQTAGVIAKNDKCRDIGIIIMTVSEEEDYQVTREMASLSLIVDYIRKPLTKETLIPKLAKIIK